MIRPAVPADLDLLAGMAGSRDRAEVRLQAAARGDESMLVADDAGVVSVRWWDGCDPPHPWLYGLFVEPAARGRGVGRKLVEAAEALAAGAVFMSLDAGEAAGFYRRLGYVVVREHRHHWRWLDPRTGAVTATGTADTWIMRHRLE